MDPPTHMPCVRFRHDLLERGCACGAGLGGREGCGQQRRCQGRQKRKGNKHNANRDVLKYTEKNGFGYVSSLNSFWNGKKAMAVDIGSSVGQCWSYLGQDGRCDPDHVHHHQNTQSQDQPAPASTLAASTCAVCAPLHQAALFHPLA